MEARQPVALEAVKKQVDDDLANLFASKIKAAEKLSGRYANLWQNIAKLAAGGGKRLRPYLLNLAFEAYGGELPSQNAQTAGLAIELLHLSLLVHDDIIDEDYERHGQPNIAGRYFAEYSATASGELAKHYASSAALLAGDLLLAEASKLISSIGDKKVSQIFYAAIFEVASGELADFEANIIAPGINRLEISRQKTASYSFTLPLSIGASLAGASRPELDKLRTLASQLGTIYQLKDDQKDEGAYKGPIAVQISKLTATSRDRIELLAIEPSFKSVLKKLI